MIKVKYTKCRASLEACLLGVIRYLDEANGLLYMDESMLERANSGFREISPGVWSNDSESTVEVVDVPRSGAPDAFHEKKADQGKPRFDLLDNGVPNALLDVARVLTWAVEVKGYQPHSWKEVPEAKRRYQAALSRHRNAQARGEVLDPESGLPHAAHINCCTLFLAELDYIQEAE